MATHTEQLQEAEEKLRRRTEELVVLHQVALAGAEAQDADDLMAQVTEILAHSLYSENVGFLLIDRENKTIRPHPTYHGVSPEILGWRIPLGQGISGTVAQTGRPMLIPDVRCEPRYLEASPTVRSELCVPVSVEGEIAGVINVESPYLEAFSEEDLHLVLTVAGHVGMALEKLRLFDDMRWHNRELAARNAIARAVTRSLDLDDILEQLYREVQRLLAPDTFVVALYDSDQETIDVRLAVEGGERLPLLPIPPGDDGELTAWVIRQRQPLLVRDLEAEAECLPIQPQHVTRPARSWLGIPLVARDRVVGTLSVQSFQPAAFDQADLDFLSAVADQVATAIENARLLDAERRARQQAETLQQLGTALSSTLDLEQLLDLILEELGQLVPYDSASVMLVERRTARMVAGRGFPEPARVLKVQVTLDDDPLFQEVAETRHPIVLADASGDARFRGLGGTDYIRGWICVPLIARDQVVGLLTLGSRRPEAYDEEDVALVQTFASHAAIAVENAWLYQEAVARGQELATLFEASQAMSGSLELDEVLRTVAKFLLRAVDVHSCTISDWDRAGEQVVTRFTLFREPGRETWPGTPGQAFSLRDYPATAWVLRTRQPLAIRLNDPEADSAEVALMREFGVKAYLMLPLVAHDEVIGLVGLEDHEQERDFSPDELRLAQTLVSHAAVAIDNARFFEQIRRQAITDPLTGLYNRRHFYQELEREVLRSQRYGRPLSLVILDLDDFKKYNDHFGHLAGDDLLRELADLVHHLIRQTDVAFRYGGEEFTLILPETARPAALASAERLRQAVEAHEFGVRGYNQVGRITISVGVATLPDDAQDGEGLVNAADMALLEAKQVKNRVCTLVIR